MKPTARKDESVPLQMALGLKENNTEAKIQRAAQLAGRVAKEAFGFHISREVPLAK